MIQVGSTSDYSPRRLRMQLADRFPTFTVQTLQKVSDISEAYDSFRDQYHSTRLLALLEKHAESLQVNRMLGVAADDLYVPGMNFVFGEARCPGRVAVISTSRLKQSTSSSSQLLSGRVLKEAVHEVGHMLGLKHCADTLCVMHFSEYIGDTDRKNSTFCRSCASDLEMQKID